MSKIYVDEIHPKTSGNQVLFPEKPAFRISKSSTSGPHSTGEIDLEFDVTGDDSQNCFMQGGITLSSSTNIVVPVGGLYYFHGIARINGFGTGYALFRLSRNGVITDRSDTYCINGSPDGSHESLNVSSIFKMNANDYVKLSFQSDADTSWNVSDDTFFTGYLIG